MLCLPGQHPGLKNFDLALIKKIRQDIVRQGWPVAWTDIIGQERVKQLVQEAAVWPALNPRLFQVSQQS